MAKKTVVEKKKSPHTAYQRALAAFKRDPHNDDKLRKVCEHIPPAPPKKGGGK